MKITKTKQPVFLNDFSCVEDVVFYFNIGADRWSDKHKQEDAVKNFNNRYIVLFADYTYENYNGDAYVLGFDKEGGKWFEVHASHCSCYGLEDKWDTELHTKQSLTSLLKARKFEKESTYYRRAMSSVEFKNWLET